MKPIIEERDIKTSGISSARKMTIAEGQQHVLFNVVRKKMYKDAISAIFREYLANALDEHVRLNKVDVPFKVTFPNALEPTLKIRDYGRGLLPAVYVDKCVMHESGENCIDENCDKSHCGGDIIVTDWNGVCQTCHKDAKMVHGVFHFFGKYGASDKRETNALIGQFGLGCKVGQAYGDSFGVTSFYNGKKYIFNVFIGQDGNGDIVKIGDDFDTDEPNGVEISVAVEAKHLYEFVEKGLKIVKYLPTIPIIEGLTSVPDFNDKRLITSGTGWRYYSGDYNDHAVCKMGGIVYELDYAEMGHISSIQRQLLHSNLHIDIAIGEVDITSSRESLEFTDRTREAIKAKLIIVQSEMVEQTKKAFANAKTEFEVRKLYWTTMKSGSGFGDILRQELGYYIMWNGKKISDSIIDFTENLPVTATPKHKIVTYSKTQRHRRRRSGGGYIDKIDQVSENRIVCTPDIEERLFIDDCTDGKSYNYKRRAETLFEADPALKTVWILQTTDQADFEKVTGLEIKNLKSYNAVVPKVVVVTRASNGTDLAKRAKHQTKVFRLDHTVLVDGYKKAASDNWKTASIDLSTAEGVYIVIDRFQPTKCYAGDLNKLGCILSKLAIVGVKTHNVAIYGFKPSVTDFGELKHFDEWVKEQVEAIPNLEVEYALALEQNSSNFELQTKRSELSGKALEYVELYRQIGKLSSDNMSEKRYLLELIGKQINKSNKLWTLKNELDAQYPLLRYISPTYDAQNAQEVLDYMKDCEKKQSVVSIAATA